MEQVHCGSYEIGISTYLGLVGFEFMSVDKDFV